MFNIAFLIPDENKAWSNLFCSIHLLEWFERNNRPYMMKFLRSKNNQLLNEMIDDAELTKADNGKQFFNKYFERFKTELFDVDEYKKRVKTLEPIIPIVQKCYPKFEALNKNWGFKIWDEYKININCYRKGAGYSYDCDTGVGAINFGYCSDIPEKDAAILAHEMLHLGIEEIIVRQFDLQQEEKERIVDNLCIYVFDGINEIDNSRKLSDGSISQYQEVANVCSYMDECIGAQPETNLIQSIDGFLQKFPVEKRYKN